MLQLANRPTQESAARHRDAGACDMVGAVTHPNSSTLRLVCVLFQTRRYYIQPFAKFKIVA